MPNIAMGEMLAAAADERRGDDFLHRALTAARTHLGLQVAYISEFENDETVFRVVDAPGLEHLAQAGDRRSLDDVYCRHILAGRLPELIHDTAAEPLAAALPITAAIPIGVHVSVPLRMPDGEVYGMFCCLGPAADRTLTQRDVGIVRTFADLASFHIAETRDKTRARDQVRIRIEGVVGGGRSCVYQPIWNLPQDCPIGVEALTRFSAEPVRSPDLWFAEAASVGLGADLELAAIATALDVLALLPPPLYLAFNASPATVMDPRLPALLEGMPLDRLVLEVTEHEAITDLAAINAALAPLRESGLRVAVDDAGAGYSGLQQILELKPDVIKLDRSLIEGIQGNPAKGSLAVALASFAQATGCRLVAEGVETEDELAMLRAAGVENVQGYLLGRPLPIAETLAAWTPRAAASVLAI